MELYNSLHDMVECDPLVPTLEIEVIPRLLDLVRKYNLDETVGISLAHKHWDLRSDDEKVVDLENHSHTISSVFTNGKPNPQTLQSWNLFVPESPAIVPSKFLVRGSDMIPYEYDCVDSNEATSRLARIEALPAAFLEQFTALAALSPMPEIMGLTVLPSGGVPDQWESSYVKSRLNVSTFGVNNSPDFHGVATLWLVDNDGPIKCKKCGQYTSHHSAEEE